MKQYDFSFQMNSDIWSELVPCAHCEKSFDAKTLKKEGLLTIRKHWHDNSLLAQLNKVRLNEFMKQMMAIVNVAGGYCELDHGGLGIYEGVSTKREFIENYCLLNLGVVLTGTDASIKGKYIERGNL